MAFAALIALALFPMLSAPAIAEGLPQPKGRIILTVTGKIGNTNVGDKAEFDREMLRSMETQTLSVTTGWTDGTQLFGGVPMRDLMAAVGAQGKKVEAIALNDYTYTIDIEDFSRYPVILATTLNGKVLRIRDKGPLWIVYPVDRFSETERISIERRMVWQLRKLIVK